MAIDESIPARKFLKTWQQIFKERPKAILVISGHWDTKEPTVNVVNRNDTIYDFYGFPKSMYKGNKMGVPDKTIQQPKQLVQQQDSRNSYGDASAAECAVVASKRRDDI
ncbi:hypothetical protein NC651_039353 [Populus alba x Populus x berolinensis]|nr:hypothetical protein NC651_039353 [Populus alba x Populus x berolinensis]